MKLKMVQTKVLAIDQAMSESEYQSRDNGEASCVIVLCISRALVTCQVMGKQNIGRRKKDHWVAFWKAAYSVGDISHGCPHVPRASSGVRPHAEKRSEVV